MPAKRVKVSLIHESLESEFSPQKYSFRAVSSLLKEAFPEAYTQGQRAGKSRVMHLHGVSWQAEDTSTPLSDSQGEASSVVGTQVSTSVETENQELRQKIEHLEARVRELEQSSVQTLCAEAASLVQEGSLVSSGPDTLERFEQYSLDGILSELQMKAPNLLNLVLTIADADRNASFDEAKRSKEQTKAVSSLCTLLNARSERTKGLQLGMSMMLIARATNRQVCKYTTNISFIHPIRKYMYSTHTSRAFFSRL